MAYEPALAKGEDPRALAKEYVRRWLVEQGFRGEGTPPPLSAEVRIEAARRYIEIAEVLTGRPFTPDLSPPEPRLAKNLGVS